MISKRHLPQVFWLPLIHFLICLTAMLGFLMPQLQFLGILIVFANIADFPISLGAFALSFHHDALAWSWMLVVGTLWWYFLARAAQFLHHRFLGRTSVNR
jgi:hypothetical protein